MESNAWFNTAQDFAPGREMFRSERRFQLWAQTVSHGQLLLRSPNSDSEPTRIDLLFKPVTAMKLRGMYDGLVVRCARDDEAAAVRESLAPLALESEQILILETGGIPDFVACSAFGWLEDHGDFHEPSRLGAVPPGAVAWGP